MLAARLLIRWRPKCSVVSVDVLTSPSDDGHQARRVGFVAHHTFRRAGKPSDGFLSSLGRRGPLTRLRQRRLRMPTAVFSRGDLCRRSGCSPFGGAGVAVLTFCRSYVGIASVFSVRSACCQTTCRSLFFILVSGSRPRVFAAGGALCRGERSVRGRKERARKKEKKKCRIGAEVDRLGRPHSRPCGSWFSSRGPRPEGATTVARQGRIEHPDIAVRHGFTAR